MATFLEYRQADLAGVFTDLGRAARYSPAQGGAVLEGTVVLQIGDGFDQGALGTNPAEVGKMRVRLSEFPDPQIDDEFTITDNGEAWKVTRPLSRNQLTVLLEVVRSGRMGMSR